MNSNIQNKNYLYNDAVKLCKFMKRMADLQQNQKLTRIRLSLNNDEFPIINKSRWGSPMEYNERIKRKVEWIVMGFCRADRHFRDENFGKPDDSIHIRFIMKKANEEKIVFDKSNLLNKEVKVYILIKDGELNYNDNIVRFVGTFINKTFPQLYLTNKEEYKKIVDSERYTKEELIKAYNLEGILN